LRLFVGAYPPPEAAAHLGELVSRLELGRPQPPGHSLRLAATERWHVTLAFLGEVPDDRVAVVSSALLSVHPPDLALRIAGGGRFGRGRFTTVWAGLRGDVDELRNLARATRRQLKRSRLPFDTKPFRPHVTLARPGDRLPAEALARDLEALDGYEGPQWTVTDVRLVRSFLGPEPRYETVADL
jgi:RNA 2',3'-cyclic 3'-phosphodiesterase